MSSLRIRIVKLAQGTSGRDLGELFSETLNSSAFMVHADQQRRISQRMDVMRQVMELLAVLIVARKQDDHTDHRILKNFDFFIRQTGSGDINYDWSERTIDFFHGLFLFNHNHRHC